MQHGALAEVELPAKLDGGRQGVAILLPPPPVSECVLRLKSFEKGGRDGIRRHRVL